MISSSFSFNTSPLTSNCATYWNNTETSSKSETSNLINGGKTISSLSAVIITATTTENEGLITFISTFCHENKCSTSEVSTGITVITSTRSGVIFSYTTYCPLSTVSEKFALTPTTTPLCLEGSPLEMTTGVEAMNTTVEGVKTFYTTYRSIESEYLSFPSYTSRSLLPQSIISTQQGQTGGVSFSSLTKEAVSEVKTVTSYVEDPSSAHSIQTCENSSCSLVEESVSMDSFRGSVTKISISEISPSGSLRSSVSTFEGIAVKAAGSSMIGLIIAIIFT